MFNLETPLSDEITPIEKEGLCFCVSSKSVNGLKKLNPTVFALANNHILDQGIHGLKSAINNRSHVEVEECDENIGDKHK